MNVKEMFGLTSYGRTTHSGEYHYSLFLYADKAGKSSTSKEIMS